MAESVDTSGTNHASGSKKRAYAYSFLGFAILVTVIVATIFLFPWSHLLRQWRHSDFVSANDAMARKDWNRAVALFSKSLKANSGDAFAAYVGRSRAYVQLGNLDKALEDAEAAVEKKPLNAAAYGQRGITKKLQQKQNEALQDFGEAIKLDPGYWWAYAQRADIYSRSNEQGKALDEVNKVLSSKPDFVEGLRLRGWILNRMGKCREAYEDFKKVSELNPNDAWSMQDKAWFLLTCSDEKLQDPLQALELAKRALELSEGKDGVVYETLAEAHFRHGDPLKASELQRKAIELGSKKCPDRSCIKEMEQRLQKYELAARPEIRIRYEILPMDSIAER
jgi:tetratricopeptide (TPR) repeat protein